MTAQPYQVTVTDKTNQDAESKKIIGGLLGRTSLGLLFIDLFFIPKTLRVMGSARR